MRRNRNSYIETSYTGVGAFSSAPAPNSNALAAASVIGNALKNNNHNPNGLQFPKIQPPRATLAQRAGSITSNSQSNLRSNPSKKPSFRSSIHETPSRHNSVDTATARRLSLTSIPKQRLSYQKSAPILKGRRSVSDFTDSHTDSKPILHLPVKNIPRTIKKYIPSANGLVAIEVPNPEHPDNKTVSQKQGLSGKNLYRRTVSLAHIPSSRENNKISSLTQKKQNMSQNPETGKEPRRSITKNIKRETKILPNGTKVISTTVEEYYNAGSDAEFDDAYENFDGEIDNKHVDMSVTLDENDFKDEAEVVVAHDYSTHDILNEIHEEDEEEKPDRTILDELEKETKYENAVKEAIAKNEELESYDREKAFASVEEPINDSVVVEDLLTRKFTHTAEPHMNKVGLNGIVSHGLSSSATPAVETPTALKKLDFDSNIQNSYDDFYDSAYERKEPVVDSYQDEIEESDYANDIDENDDYINPTYNTKNATEKEYSEEEYLAAHKKLDELVKQKEQEILESLRKQDQSAHMDYDDTEEEHIVEHAAAEPPAANKGQSILEEILVKQTTAIDEQPSIIGEPAAIKKSLAVEDPAATEDQSYIVEELISENKGLSIVADKAPVTADETYVVNNATTITESKEPVKVGCTEPVKQTLDGPKFQNIAPVTITDITQSEYIPSTPKKVSSNQIPASEEITNTPVSESSYLFNNSRIIDSTPSNPAITQSVNVSPTKKSMAQHLRPTVAVKQAVSSLQQNTKIPAIGALQVKQNENFENINDLKVPMREPIIQAIIDEKSRSNSLKTNSVEKLEENTKDELKKTLQATSSTTSLTKRKSVLKNSNSNYQTLYVNNSNNASDAYLSLATAQNTKLNSKTLSPAVSNRRLSVGTMQDPNYGGYTRSRSGSAASSTANLNNDIKAPLAAAARAAQRHSAQPGTLNKQFDQSVQNKRNSSAVMGARDINNVAYDQIVPSIASQKASNAKVEEAKRRIFANSPSSTRAKELYEKSKARPQVKTADLVALNMKTNSIPRRSSFEKVSNDVAPTFGTNPETNPNYGKPKERTNMVSLSLREQSDLNYANYNNTHSHTNRGFKSRFADDNSDTDVPLPSFFENTPIPAAPPQPSETPIVSEKQKSSSGFKLFKKKDRTELTPKEQKESRFEKFFVEQHGPSSQRNFSGTSVYTETSMNTEGKKKKGFFKKMFNN